MNLSATAAAPAAPATAARTLTLVFHCDPAHGWLAVPVKYLHELGITGSISRFSYLSRNHAGGDRMAYLEEDCDAELFTRAAVAAGWLVRHRDAYTDSYSFIRRLPAYDLQVAADPWAADRARDPMGTKVAFDGAENSLEAPEAGLLSNLPHD